MGSFLEIQRRDQRWTVRDTSGTPAGSDKRVKHSMELSLLSTGMLQTVVRDIKEEALTWPQQGHQHLGMILDRHGHERVQTKLPGIWMCGLWGLAGMSEVSLA
jgi:hypothetical protein